MPLEVPDKSSLVPELHYVWSCATRVQHGDTRSAAGAFETFDGIIVIAFLVAIRGVAKG